MDKNLHKESWPIPYGTGMTNVSPMGHMWSGTDWNVVHPQAVALRERAALPGLAVGEPNAHNHLTMMCDQPCLDWNQSRANFTYGK